MSLTTSIMEEKKDRQQTMMRLQTVERTQDDQQLREQTRQDKKASRPKRCGVYGSLASFFFREREENDVDGMVE